MKYTIALIVFSLGICTSYAVDPVQPATEVHAQTEDGDANLKASLHNLAQQVTTTARDGLPLAQQKELGQTITAIAQEAQRDPADARKVLGKLFAPYRDATVAVLATGLVSYGSPRPIRFLRMIFVAGSIYAARQISEDGSQEIAQLKEWWLMLKEKMSAQEK